MVGPTATAVTEYPTSSSVAATWRPLPTVGALPKTVVASPAPQTGEAPAEIVQAAVRAALDLIGLPEGSPVRVVRAEAILWPDGSLGCPEPGVVYTQAEVPGYWVELDVDDRHVDFRFGTAGVPVLCAR